VIEKLPAGRGRLHPPSGLLEQRAADLLLEPIDLEADGGYRAADALGRGRERARIGNGDEGTQEVDGQGSVHC
jgi:hypothetical protein